MVSSMKRGSGMAGVCLKHHQIHFLKYSTYTLHDVIMMSLSNGHSFQFMHMKVLSDGCLRIFVAGAMMYLDLLQLRVPRLGCSHAR